MKAKLDLAAHLIFGAMFLVFGLNGFFNFLPMPPMSDQANAFMGGLAGAGYFFPLLKGVEVICGLALLTRRFVPLALLILAPVVVQILLFHVFLDLAGLPMALVVVALEAYLGFGVHMKSFRTVLQATP
jgi:putative oxidoreductase